MRMHAKFALLVVLACTTLANTASAQSILAFDRSMQKAEKRSLSMQRALKRKDADTAIADAKELQALYKSMEDYFATRSDSRDGVKLFREGRELAAKVIDSASANDFDSAFKSAITIAKACRDCHNAYKPLD